MMNAETTGNGTDKVKAYGWKIKSEPGEFRLINKRLLQVNPEYQRESSKSKQLELASNWSWIACGALCVAERFGDLWVVDGQHRKLAADRRSDIRELPCLVFQVESIEDEARAFLDTNANRKPVTAIAKFKASLVARDPVAIKVSDAINKFGLRIATASKDPGDIKSVSLCLQMCEQDEADFIEVLSMASELALAERAPVHEKILRGLHYIHRNVDGGLRNPRLRDRLHKVGMSQLSKAARSAAEFFDASGARVYAMGMMQSANKGLQNKISLGEGE